MNKYPVVQGWLQQKGSVELDHFQGGALVNRWRFLDGLVGSKFSRSHVDDWKKHNPTFKN